MPPPLHTSSKCPFGQYQQRSCLLRRDSVVAPAGPRKHDRKARGCRPGRQPRQAGAQRSRVGAQRAGAAAAVVLPDDGPRGVPELVADVECVIRAADEVMAAIGFRPEEAEILPSNNGNAIRVLVEALLHATLRVSRLSIWEVSVVVPVAEAVHIGPLQKAGR